MAASEDHSSPDTIKTKTIVHFRTPTAGMDCPDLKYERRKMISDPKTAVGIGSCIRLVAEDEGTVDGKICGIRRRERRWVEFELEVDQAGWQHYVLVPRIWAHLGLIEHIRYIFEYPWLLDTVPGP